MVITPTTLTITQLLGSTNEQYVIPAYQRRYSWRYAQVAALWDDIDAVTGTDTSSAPSSVSPGTTRPGSTAWKSWTANNA
jgi:hypothetical protein